MPSQQPNENMDKVLKAYAQKRRDDGGQMEMDLATRNMLQAEVARKLAPVPVVGKARPRFAWWPQIIMGVAGCAAVAIALILWLPSQSGSKEKLIAAKASSAPVAATPSPSTTLAATPSPSASPVATTSSSESLASTPSSAAKLAASASDLASADVAKDTSRSSFSYDWKKNGAELPTGNLTLGGKNERSMSESDLSLGYGAIDKDLAVFATNSLSITNSMQLDGSAILSDDEGKSQLLASRAPSSPVFTHEIAGNNSTPAISVPALSVAPAAVASAKSAAPAEARGVGGELAVKQVANVNQLAKQLRQSNMRFTQIDNRAQYRRNINSPPLPKVLTNFAVQRNGSNVSVVDSDGSVYNGNIVINLDAESSTRARSFFDTRNGGQQNAEIPEDTFAFSVSGYNRKLKAKVVFSGNVTNAFIITNGQFQNAAPQAAEQVQNTQTVNAPQQQSLPQNLLLNGRVQIGRRTEFDIQAAPTK